MLAPWKKSYGKLRQHIKKRNITLPAKVHIVKTMVFPVVMYGCESWTSKESCVPKNWFSWTVVLGKILESPLDCKEIKPVNPKRNQPWIFIGRTEEPGVLQSLESQRVINNSTTGWRRQQQKTTLSTRVQYLWTVSFVLQPPLISRVKKVSIVCTTSFIRLCHTFVLCLDCSLRFCVPFWDPPTS